MIVTLKIDDSIKDKFLWLLKHFSKKEIIVLEKYEMSDDEYIKSIPELEESIIKESKKPDNEFVTLDKLEW
ncbi:hypothetical protein [Nitrosophilus labii]|uniref:hypothetical protein n=1 Tax=Nitrosophilus labii TaxID=2706014 RepID=UPI001656EACE|nr:hypothetical protein [Nitrosophilus labii]